MHELGITQSILQIVLHHAEQAGAVRVQRVHLVIGQLSSVVDESVQFYWDIVSEGTPAHGAELCFRRVEARLRCADCGHEFPLNAEDYTCPACGGQRVHVTGGDEFYIESIDVDLAEDVQHIT